jgi:hypothetical protein
MIDLPANNKFWAEIVQGARELTNLKEWGCNKNYQNINPGY